MALTDINGLAKKYNVRRLTIKRWCQRARIKLKRHGKLLLADADHLERWLGTGAAKSTASRPRGAVLRWAKAPSWPGEAAHGKRTKRGAPRIGMKTTEDAWWLIILQRGSLPDNELDESGRPAALACSGEALARDYAERFGLDLSAASARRALQTSIGLFLKRVVPGFGAFNANRGGKRYRVYLFGDLDKCREAFAQHVGKQLAWAPRERGPGDFPEMRGWVLSERGKAQAEQESCGRTDLAKSSGAKN